MEICYAGDIEKWFVRNAHVNSFIHSACGWASLLFCVCVCAVKYSVGIQWSPLHRSAAGMNDLCREFDEFILKSYKKVNGIFGWIVRSRVHMHNESVAVLTTDQCLNCSSTSTSSNHLEQISMKLIFPFIRNKEENSYLETTSRLG